MTHSVYEEIKRFEKEINKVAENNVKYSTWKQMKTGAQQTRESQENIKDSKKDIDKYKAEQLHPNEKVVQLAQALELPPRRKNTKKVSYAENEVTVFNFSKETPNSLTVIQEVTNSRSSSRQIQPSLHTAPADPPTADSDDLTIRHTEDYTSDAEEDFPVLPSVKKLANRFRVNKADDPKPAIVNNTDPSVRVPAMMKVQKPNSGYHQVHSITARSVPREFCESLRLGKSEVTDTIFKLPEANKNEGQTGTVWNKSNSMETVVSSSSNPRFLYPDGEYSRTYSPEYSGIPALPAVIPSKSNDEQGYSSEDSRYTPGHGSTWRQ